MFLAVKPGFRSLALKLVMNVVGELWTEKNSCGIARFPCDSTAFLLPILKMQVDSIPSGFISQQDDAPAHTAGLAQDWIATNCSVFNGKGKWPVGHRTRRTLTVLIITSEELCLNTTRISSETKEHRRTEESLAVNVGPVAAGLNQQVHTELHTRLRAVWKLMR